MLQTQKLLGQGGATFRHFYVNTPVCCPSRSEFLSGRLHHNIRDDTPELGKGGSVCMGDSGVSSPIECGCMHVNSTTAAFEGKTYADYMQQAGYVTGCECKTVSSAASRLRLNLTQRYCLPADFGKYLNPPSMKIYCERNGSHFPGWTAFMGMCNTAYYNVHWNDDGDLTFTGSAPNEYSTSIVGNRTVSFIRQALAATPHKPFLAIAATRAPRGPETPAPWYADALPQAVNRVTPAFNFSAAGHVPWVANLPPLSAGEAAGLDKAFRNRWRTLLSVDDLVAAVVRTIDDAGAANRSYIFFTSDHGFHLGHMRLAAGKRHHYEFDARVPFLVRGPGIVPGSTQRELLGNVDWAPTILDLAGWRSAASAAWAPPSQMDGSSFATQLMGRLATPALMATWSEQGGEESPKAAREEFLLEFDGLKNWPNGEGPLGTCNKPGGPKCARLNDCPNNTYRALRVVTPANESYLGLGLGGNLLFTEFTSAEDWFYHAINFRSLFDLDSDPFQLTNLFASVPAAGKAQLQARLAKLWRCVGDECP
jgi:N-acetylglucosamine-6-sulfatase